MNRVIFYIDGFNLYYGLKSKSWKKYYWLNIEDLCKRLLSKYENRKIEEIQYFTARIKSPADKVKRQSAYLKALSSLDNVRIIEGRYYENTGTCSSCGFHYRIAKEKMTDVNIAMNLSFDCFLHRFDTAYVISADSDYVPIIRRIRDTFKNKKVVIAFPPGRSSNALKKTSSAYFQLYEVDLRNSQFPTTILTKLGNTIHRPDSWS